MRLVKETETWGVEASVGKNILGPFFGRSNCAKVSARHHAVVLYGGDQQAEISAHKPRSI